MTMARIFWGSSPAAFMRLKVSRQERPASTRMLVLELESTVQLPRLPLARTVMRNGTDHKHNFIPVLRKEESFLKKKACCLFRDSAPACDETHRNHKPVRAAIFSVGQMSITTILLSSCNPGQ